MPFVRTIPARDSTINTDMLKIGDKIKDTEDTDCYFVGEVVKLNSFKGVEYYKVTQIIWNGIDHKDDKLIGQIIAPRWWYIEQVI